MNVVIKIFIVLFLYSLGSHSQTKKDDAFYILDKNHKDYTLKPDIINNETSNFRLYNRTEYKKRKDKILKDKRKGKFHGYQFYKRPKELTFNKVYGSKIETINYCDINSLNLVDYKWIQDNTWKENNPNILFKNLYFLLKIEKKKYLKFKVERTVIAY
ncbi:hypothetical protein [Tenacibaculum sp. nBUS_03]|uniref:hypothetical protein n=1 Tax=Tenacibaculum sp. nBUS_03 TaxID=3395320 RepID=UPI003EBC8F27